MQAYGVDYQETFAMVAKMNTIHILLSFPTNFGWSLQQLDVKNGFLHDDLKEVYMQTPLHFNGDFKRNNVCKLKKPFSSLKQSPKAWFGRFAKAMNDMELQQSQGDHTLFVKCSHMGKLIIAIVYIDDITMTRDDSKEIERLKKKLAKEIEIKDF